jgi:5-methylcytosine-specific restriction endonuclease McrA
MSTAFQNSFAESGSSPPRSADGRFVRTEPSVAYGLDEIAQPTTQCPKIAKNGKRCLMEAGHPGGHATSPRRKPHLRRSRRAAIIRRLVPVYGWVCWYCGLSLRGVETHVDHIVPKSAGGGDDDENLALTCHWCNMAKREYSVEEFLAWLEHIRATDSPITKRKFDSALGVGRAATPSGGLLAQGRESQWRNELLRGDTYRSRSR